MNKIKIIAVSIGLVILSACGDEEKVSESITEVNAETISKNLSNYPKGVQLGYIAPEYSDVVHDFMDEYFVFSEKANEFLSNGKNEELRELSKEYIVYLNGINYFPQSDIEKEIDEYLWSVIYHQENLGNYLIKYVDSGDKTYYTMSSDEWDSSKQDVEILIEILTKYELFYEE